MTFNGKVIQRVVMKFNGVVVAESFQTPTAVVDAETERLMALLEAWAKRTE